jgi:hypothetical protein
VYRLLEHQGTLLVGYPRHRRQYAKRRVGWRLRRGLVRVIHIPGLHKVTSDGNAYFLFQLSAVGVTLGFELDDGWTRRIAGVHPPGLISS